MRMFQGIVPKPWLTVEVRKEITLRNRLKFAAKKSKKSEEFDEYRAQRAKVCQMETNLRHTYFQRFPGEVRKGRNKIRLAS